MDIWKAPLKSSASKGSRRLQSPFYHYALSVHGKLFEVNVDEINLKPNPAILSEKVSNLKTRQGMERVTQILTTKTLDEVRKVGRLMYPSGAASKSNERLLTE